MMHGKTSLIKVVKDTQIFKDLPKRVYTNKISLINSWKREFTKEIIVTSYSADDEEIMSLER